jgi:hypothetical protein
MLSPFFVTNVLSPFFVTNMLSPFFVTNILDLQYLIGDNELQEQIEMTTPIVTQVNL